MFDEVNNFLNLKGDSPQSGKSILVSDFTCDYGSFLVHHFISYFLKNRFTQSGTTIDNKHLCLISFAQSLNHFHCVAQKFGLNLRQLQESGSLIFVDGLKFLGQAISRSGDTETIENNPLNSALLQRGSLKEFFLYLRSQVNFNEEGKKERKNIIPYFMFVKSEQHQSKLKSLFHSLWQSSNQLS